MKNQRTYLICDTCNTMVGLMDDGGGTVVCCGKPMRVLEANTTDAAKEKHVPIAVREGCLLKVSVGSAAHPMTDEHHIAWVATAQGGHTQRITLSPKDAPAAEFCVEDAPLTVYAYCNLHGLWKAEV